MDLLVNARNALVYAGQQHQSVGEGTKSQKVLFKTDRAIRGLGENQLSEKGRQIGIKAYTDAIQRYALRGLLNKLVALVNNRQGLSLNEALAHIGLDNISKGKLDAADITPPLLNWPILPWNESSHANSDALWKHQHLVLLNELPSMLASGNTDSNNNYILSDLLKKCITLEDDHAERVYKSKSRDDERGAKTVPGYRDAHVAAEKDSVVLMAKKEADDVRRDVQIVQEALGVVNIARSRL